LAYIFDPIRNTFVDDEDTSLGNKLALNDNDELDKAIRQLDEQFGPRTTFPASEAPTPPKTIERDMFKNAFKESAADGGMIGGGTIAGQDMGDRTGFATPINVYKEKTKSGKTTYRVKLKNDVRVPATSEEDAIQKLLADGQEIKYLGADKQQVLDWIKNSKNPVTTDEIADYIKSNQLKVRRSHVTNAVKNNPEYEGKVILAKERRAPFLNEDGTISKGMS